jgi:hypothetical protein
LPDFCHSFLPFFQAQGLRSLCFGTTLLRRLVDKSLMFFAYLHHGDRVLAAVLFARSSGEKVMVPDRVDERKAASDLERGSGASLSQLLAGKFEEERMRVFHRVEQIYNQDQASHTGVKADLTFNTSDFWHNEIQVTDNKSGKILYDDVLNLKTLTHTEQIADLRAADRNQEPSTRTFAAPSDREPIDQNYVSGVTRDLENGDPTSLGKALDGKMQEERVRFLNAVASQNQDDLVHHRTKYEMEVQVEGFKHHTNELSVGRIAPGSIFTLNFWNNPASLYFDSVDMNSDKRTVSLQRDDRK